MIAAIVIVGALLLIFLSAKGQVEDAQADIAAQAAREGKEPVGYVTGSSAGDTGCLLVLTVIAIIGFFALFGGAINSVVPLLPK